MNPDNTPWHAPNIRDLHLPGPFQEGLWEIAAHESISVDSLLAHIDAFYRRRREPLGRAVLVFVLTYFRNAALDAGRIRDHHTSPVSRYDPRREV